MIGVVFFACVKMMQERERQRQDTASAYLYTPTSVDVCVFDSRLILSMVCNHTTTVTHNLRLISSLD